MQCCSIRGKFTLGWCPILASVIHKDLAPDSGFSCGWNVYYKIMCLALLITFRMTMTRVSESRQRVGGERINFLNFYINSIESIGCVGGGGFGSGWACNGTWHFATCTRPNHPPTPQWLHKFELFPNKMHFKMTPSSDPPAQCSPRSIYHLQAIECRVFN